jgi:hypothetical protein
VIRVIRVIRIIRAIRIIRVMGVMKVTCVRLNYKVNGVYYMLAYRSY